MFGYIEGDYSTLKKHSHPLRDRSGEMHYELRQCAHNLPYIAVYSLDEDSNILLDKLFIYDSKKYVYQDWSLITSANTVVIDDLNFVERIEDHGTGIGIDGSITMY